MKRFIITTLAIALVLPFWASTTAMAEDGFVDKNGDGIDDTSAYMHRKGMRMRGGLGGDILWTSTALTEEQRAAIRTKVEELREAGASFEDIRAARSAMLAGYGITITDDAPWRMGRGGLWTGSKLTDEQQAEIQAEVDRLKAEGATRDAIRAAAAGLLAGYGYQLSEDTAWRMSHSPFSRMSARLGSVLSEEELASLEARIEALRADGLSPQDMRDAVHKELDALGLDLPAPQDRGKYKRGGRHDYRPR